VGHRPTGVDAGDHVAVALGPGVPRRTEHREEVIDMEMMTAEQPLVELESLDAPGWGAAFWTGVGVGVAVGVVVLT
jgi:hypothetical protein